MQKITLVSLGSGSRTLLTLGTLEILTAARHIILRTGHTDAAAYLREQGLAFETLDALYESCEDFDLLCSRAVEAVAAAARRHSVVYAVCDVLSDETAQALWAAYPQKVCFAGSSGNTESLLLGAGTRLPVRICSASSLTVPCTQDALLIAELSSRLLAGECKLKLSAWYGDETEVLFFPPSEKAKRACTAIPLWELDQQKRYDHTSALYLPALPLEKRSRFDLWDLVRLLSRLRGENGCPWDRAQTHETLSRYLIEEAYEVSEAVHAQDWEHVAEELGDVLLQVFFQADIASQYSTFSLDDVTTAICRKMMTRHAHIFGDISLATPQDVANFWEKSKQLARGNTTPADVLKDVSDALPALLRAEKVLKKAESLNLSADALTHENTPVGAILRAVSDLRNAGRCAEEEVALALSRYIAGVSDAARSVAP